MPQPRPLRFPDFICIGAQKAGTTWLDRMLRQHPDVWLPPTKEVHYFNRVFERRVSGSNEDLRWIDTIRMHSVRKSIRRELNSEHGPAKQMQTIGCLSLIGTPEPTDETYGRIFQYAPAGSICGELTPNYARLPEGAIRHMVSLKANIKILFILRDPIERDWSQLRMQDQRKEFQHLSYVERLAGPALAGYSDYATTIERYRGHLPAENFLIHYFDDMAERPDTFLGSLCNFLGIDATRSEFHGRYEAVRPMFGARAKSEEVNAGSPAPMPSDLYQTLRQALAPVYRRLLSLNHPIVQKWYDKHYGSPEAGAVASPAAIGSDL